MIYVVIEMHERFGNHIVTTVLEHNNYQLQNTKLWTPNIKSIPSFYIRI